MVLFGENGKDETPSDIETRTSKETSTNGDSEPRPERDNYHSLVVATERTEPVRNSSAADTSRSSLGVKASPKRPKKGLQVPEAGALVLQYGQEVSTPTSIREKVSEDGYNWRKYGQKLVKGNEYVRSYYRCTHPNCPVKKQLERLHEGKVVDIVYIGQHSHSKPQVNVPVAVGFAVSIVEEKQEDPSSVTAEETVSHEKSPPPPPETVRVVISQISNVSAKESSKGEVVQSNKTKDTVFSDDDPDPKRVKKDKNVVKNAVVEKPASESRLVVQTQSEVDIVNDGYRWRKYGQKLVKGNPNPRSYYRCSTSGCPVKKHVERASHDPKVVITTYEGQHCHNVPPARTVSHNALVSSATSPPTQSDGNAVGLDMVADAIIEHESRTEQQGSPRLPSGSGVTDNECSKLVESSFEPESKQNKQETRSFVVKEESDIPIGRRTSSNLDVQPSTKSEGSNLCVVDVVIHDSIKTQVQNPDSKPVLG